MKLFFASPTLPLPPIPLPKLSIKDKEVAATNDLCQDKKKRKRKKLDCVVWVNLWQAFTAQWA